MASSSHNQQTTANRGGASSIPTPANSGGSGLFGGTDVGAAHSPPKTIESTSTTDDGSRRRASQGGQSGMFNNLNNLKRSSQDVNTANRKNSFAEQTSTPGVLGQMWHSFTKGSN